MPRDWLILCFILILITGCASHQIEKKQRELAGFESERRFEDGVRNARAFCSRQCTAIKSDDCSETAIADYCTTKIASPIDLNTDGSINYDTSFFSGRGVCEDAIYCHQIISCYCDKRLENEKLVRLSGMNLKGCVERLCSKYKEEGVPDPTATVQQVLNPGTCDVEDNAQHWWNQELPTCPD